ncbi:MAG: elongation factor 1-beta [Thermoplasmata archaeon]|jgi:elongation factor 1-beta|nr:elongation factor 1-beta [Thermoplasmata archaeon]
MGEVAVLFRLMPQSVETDLKAMGDGLRGALPAGVRVRGIQVKDIAYGLRALLVSVIMPDTGGVLEATEHALAKLPHVESVEVLEEGLL